MKNLHFSIFMAIAALGLFFTSCQKEEVQPQNSTTEFLFQNFTDLTIDDLETLNLDVTKVKPITTAFWKLKEQGLLTMDSVYEKGNPTDDLNLIAGLMIAELVNPTDVLLESEHVEETHTDGEEMAETRGFYVYKWTYGPRKWKWYWFGYKYPTKRFSHGTVLCNGFSMNNSIHYKKCSQIECVIPPACQ